MLQVTLPCLCRKFSLKYTWNLCLHRLDNNVYHCFHPFSEWINLALFVGQHLCMFVLNFALFV